jgi:2-iminobutanoate/2-iminopropanoate deaminase
MRDDRVEIFVPDLPEPASHYVHVVRAGQMIFVSGCSALDASGKVVGGDDVVGQTRQVFENLKKSLEAAGATFDDVCKMTVFLRNGADRDRINPIRQAYFGATRPASTLVEVAGFSREDVLVEIEVIAVVPAATSPWDAIPPDPLLEPPEHA